LPAFGRCRLVCGRLNSGHFRSCSEVLSRKMRAVCSNSRQHSHERDRAATKPNTKGENPNRRAIAASRNLRSNFCKLDFGSGCLPGVEERRPSACRRCEGRVALDLFWQAEGWVIRFPKGQALDTVPPLTHVLRLRGGSFKVQRSTYSTALPGRRYEKSEKRPKQPEELWGPASRSEKTNGAFQRRNAPRR
jgi:hypothetical protein